MSQFMDKAVLGEDIILKSKGQQNDIRIAILQML